MYRLDENILKNEKFFTEIKKKGFKISLRIISLEQSNGDFYLAMEHVNIFSKLLNRLIANKSDFSVCEGQLQILFPEDAVNFDIAFLGVIALLRHEFPNIKIGLNLPKGNYEIYARYRSILLTAKEWYEALSGAEFFEIVNLTSVDEDFKEQEAAFPIIPIDEKNYDIFFNSKFSWRLDEIIHSEQLTHFEKDLSSRLSERRLTANLTNFRALKETFADSKMFYKDSKGLHYVLLNILELLSNYNLLFEEFYSSPILNTSSPDFLYYRNPTYLKKI